MLYGAEFNATHPVKALYHRNRTVIWALYLLYSVEVVAMIVTLVKAVPKVGFDSACVVTSSPIELLYFASVLSRTTIHARSLTSSSIAYIGFEALLFMLTIYKLVETLYHGWGTTPVLTVIVRDGTWAFAMIFRVYSLLLIVQRLVAEQVHQ